MNSHFLLRLVAALAMFSHLQAQQRSEALLHGPMHHFGDDRTPEWPEAPADPQVPGLTFSFESAANQQEWTLAYTQRHVSNHWQITINGKSVAVCPKDEALIEHFVPIPPGTLVDGTNRFELTTSSASDDITFGRVRLVRTSFRETLGLVPVSLIVREETSLQHIPARITITDAAGELAAVYYADLPHQAARKGVVYTGNGRVFFELPAGTYRVVASRGPEWSIDSLGFTLGQNDATAPIKGMEASNGMLALRREVDTSGYVACDTHLHTLTFSGHGDSSVEERMLTLAGEGVELAISTDHNHNTDYAPYQQRMGLNAFFTTVVGNEVTTPIGHFNAFPLDPEEQVPAHDHHDLVKLVDGMREKGAQVVILNHPRWPDRESGPFGKAPLNQFTGEGLAGGYPFDAMELVNSCTDENDPMWLFKDWFALLNRGEKVVAVGSSDSHTVGEPVGGGRTYVPSSSDDPAAIDVDAACEAIATGKTSISMGIFVEAQVLLGKDQPPVSMGGLALPGDGSCEAVAIIRCPSWVNLTRAQLFANGSLVDSFDLSKISKQVPGPSNLTLRHKITDRHAGQDAWLVWVVLGDGIEGSHWPLVNDYTLGATNPIYIDWSGDGAYQSPRESAQVLFDGGGAGACVRTDHWEAVNFHGLELVRKKLLADARQSLVDLGNQAGLSLEQLEAFLDANGPR